MNCYHFSANAGREADWKTASKFCKRSGGFLLEMESIEENQDIIEHIQGLPFLKGIPKAPCFLFCNILVSRKRFLDRRSKSWFIMDLE